MRTFERVTVLAASMAVSVGIGAAGVAQAAGGSLPRQDAAQPLPLCKTQLSTASPSAGTLAAVTGAAGAVTFYGQGSAAMQTPLTFSFDLGDGSPAVTQNIPVLQHTYAFNSTYYPSVTVTDATGAKVASTECQIWVDGVKDSVHRYGGDDRYLTAAAVSQKIWADANGDATTQRRPARSVVLASGAGFADALAGVPLASYKQGPLLLTEPGGLTKATENEIRRVLPKDATVYVLGGSAAISPAVDAQLRADGYQVTRYQGKDRYGTAVQIATRGLDDPPSVIVVTGTDFADALSAGPVATGDAFGAHGKPAAIMLTDGPTVSDPATAAFIKARLKKDTPAGGIDPVLAIGGKAYCAMGSLEFAPAARTCSIMPFFVGSGLISTNNAFGNFGVLAGKDRYQTAAEVADANFNIHVLPAPADSGSGGWQDGPGLFGLASGTSYPDALTGGAAMALQHAPILLTERDALSGDTARVIGVRTTHPAPNTFEADVFGGTAAVAQGLEDALKADIRH